MYHNNHLKYKAYLISETKNNNYKLVKMYTQYNIILYAYMNISVCSIVACVVLLINVQIEKFRYMNILICYSTIIRFVKSHVIPVACVIDWISSNQTIKHSHG